MIFFIFMVCFLSACNAWSAHDHQIYKDDQIYRFKGVNWYGFDTKSRCIEGLKDNTLDFYLQGLKRNKFNCMRLPVSLELILYDHDIVPNDLVSVEPRFYNKTPIEMIDVFFNLAAPYDMNILLDVHRLRYGVSNPLWYIPDDHLYTEDRLIDGLNLLIDRYQNYPIFLGVDLYNEPHYIADYGSFNKSTDWKLFIEKSLQSFDSLFPESHFLVFVNGIDWGKNMSQFGDNLPITPPGLQDRTIFSPHLYGPTLTYFSSLEKDYLYSLWDSLFGYMMDYANLFIGEWGGKMSGKDKIWQTTFAQYLIDREIRNNFYWALNPYSNDVGGLMKSWYEFDQDKMILLDSIQPQPS